MNKVLLANSYFLKHDPKEFKAMNLYAPLGTLYAASYLESKGYEVELFDTMLAESESELEDLIKLHNPGIFVVYDDCFNYLTKMCLTRMREAAFKMCRIAKEKGCTTVISGSDAADHLENYFSNYADFVICGEGEITLGELADQLHVTSSREPADIDGLAFMAKNKIVKTKRREVLKNPDILPIPKRDLIDIDKYKELWYKHHGYFSMNVVTTRGCPYHCNWCAKPIYGQVYNSRSPENVVAELKLLKEKYSPEHIWFCDDIFGLKPGWIKEFDERVNDGGAKISFKCLSRADLLLKENTVMHLKNSGCQSVWIGAESGSQKILNAMEKGITVSQISSARKLLSENGIDCGFFIQFGYPGETKSEIEMTEEMIFKLMPDEIGISVSYPLPGTKFYENVLSSMVSKHNWEKSDDFAMMFSGEYTTAYYRDLHSKIHRKFRALHILKAPLKKLKHVYKLPYYLASWFYFNLKLMRVEKSEQRNVHQQKLNESLQLE